MLTSSRRWLSIFAVVLAMLVVLAYSVLDAADPDPERFTDDIAAFAGADNAAPLPPEPIVFVGSSSIRGWKVVERFPEFPILNRGFGGSQISDVNYYIEQTVLKYAPSLIFLYAGENDIAGGKSSKRVAEDYRLFLEEVSGRYPQTEVVFISIKPSPKRWHHWPDMHSANLLIRQISEADERYHFVDVSAAMLDSQGKPRASIYVSDGIHMTQEGYDLWTRLVLPVMEDLTSSKSLEVLEVKNAG